jgi:signal transduction histidine kinase
MSESTQSLIKSSPVGGVHNDVHDYAARDLARRQQAVTPEHSCEEVRLIMEANPAMVSVPVLIDGAPAGLINRTFFLGEMSKPFRRELFQHRTCSVFMDASPLVVDEGMSIPSLSQRVVGSSGQALADGFIITDECGLYVGMGNGTDLMKLVAYLQAEKNQALNAANQELKTILDTLNTTQKQLVQSEKMASLGGLVAGVSHEINTPVGVAVTAASFLENSANTFRDLFKNGQMKKSDLEKFVSIVDESAKMLLGNLQRAADLIQSFKRVAVDQTTNDISRIDLKQYLDEVILSLRPQFKNRPIDVTIRCQENITLEVPAGPLSQVFSNLLNNALLHAFDADDSGSITVTCRLLEDGRTEMRFKDTGKGIPPEVLPKIFDPFFTTKRGHGGTGLGLHILFNIVTQQLLGTVEVTSQPGAGTEFVVMLPASALVTGDTHVG